MGFKRIGIVPEEFWLILQKAYGMEIVKPPSLVMCSQILLLLGVLSFLSTNVHKATTSFRAIERDAQLGLRFELSLQNRNSSAQPNEHMKWQRSPTIQAPVPRLLAFFKINNVFFMCNGKCDDVFGLQNGWNIIRYQIHYMCKFKLQTFYWSKKKLEISRLFEPSCNLGGPS